MGAIFWLARCTSTIPILPRDPADCTFNSRYILNYLDRNNIASARLAGLETDLKLTSSQYETSVSILFVGYLLMQSKQTATTLYMLVLTISVPSNLFLNKIGKPALYLPAVMCVWGVISTCTAAVQSFGGLIAVRFVLGFVEAAYFRESRISQLGSCHDANNS
jgi:MFS family permease